jgi:hypothetical protein
MVEVEVEDGDSAVPVAELTCGWLRERKREREGG